MVKKLLVFTLIISALTLSLISASADNIRHFELSDPVSDAIYNVSYENKELIVSANEQVIGSTYIQDITACSVYNDILYIYYADILNSSLHIYCFDFFSDSIYSFAVNEDAFVNESCFASNGESFYFVSGNDYKFLCIYENEKVRKVEFFTQIKELMQINHDTLIIITSDSTYLLRNSEVYTVSSSLSSPANYIGGGLIKDVTGKVFYIDDNDVKEVEAYEPFTTSESPDISLPDEIYGGFYIAEQGITVSKLKKAFADLEIVKVTKADGTIIESGKPGTGSAFTLRNDEVITIIIYGEVTGEGNINSIDIKAVLNHLCHKEILTGAFLIAADIDSDGVITTKDALMLSQMY